MRFRFLGLSLAGFAAAATAGPHEGLKIVTRETFPAGTNETTTYVARDRVRVESRMSSQVSAGRTERHEYIHVRRCDLDRVFVLNPADRTYGSWPLRTDLTRIERFTLSLARRHNEPPGTAGLVVETTTVDTGERKMAFGHSARRVLTTRREIPVGQSVTPRETVTDGWYIDLETRPVCEREEAGHARAVLIAVASPAGMRTGMRTNTPRVTFKDIGESERGFPVESTATWRASGDKATAPSPPVLTHNLVTQLSRERFDAGLFEVPDGYRSTNGMFGSLAARWGRTAQIIRSVVASWVR